MANYLDRVGSQEFSGFKGYELPIKDVANTVSTLTEYWKQGVQQIQNKRQQALNLDVTTPQSIEFLTNTLNDIDSKIKDISNKDLSIQDNVSRATGLFAPIFNGRTKESRATLLDNQLTSHYKTQFQQAEAYKTKNGGKEYHPNNVAVLQMAYQEYQKNGNWDNISEYTNKKESYTPFYDDSKERLDLIKSCPTSNNSVTSLSNGQYTTITNKSRSSSQVLQCLDNLSEKSKQQTRIDGMVHYGKNYATLRQDYIDVANDKLKHYSEEISDLETQKAALQNNNSPEAQQRIAQLDEFIKQYQAGVNSTNDNLNGVTKQGVKYPGYLEWDDEFIKQHYGELAYQAFSNRKNTSYATSYSINDVSNSIKRDPLYVSEMIQDRMDARASKKTKSEDVVNDPLRRLSTTNGGIPTDFNIAEKTITPGYSELKEKESSYQSQLSEFDRVTLSNLKDVLPNTPIITKLIQQGGIKTQNDLAEMWRQVETYIAHAPKNDRTAEQLIKWKNDRAKLSTQRDLNRIIILSAENKATAANPNLKEQYEQASAQIFNNVEPMTLSNGETLSPQRIQNIVRGNDNKYEIKENPYKEGDQPNVYLFDKTTNQIVPNRNFFYPENSIITGIYNQYKNLKEKNDLNYEEKVNDILRQELATQRNVLQLGEVLGAKSSYRGFLSPMFFSLGKIDESYEVVTAGNYDPITGTVPVQVNTIDKGVRTPLTAQKALTEATKSGTTGADIVDDKLVIKIPGAPTLDVPTYGEQLKQIVGFAEKQLSPRNPFFLTQGIMGKDRAEYNIKVQLDPSGGYDYTILRAGKPIPVSNTNLPEKEAVLSDFNNFVLGGTGNFK